MEVLIYNHSLYTAGVETLIVRMANWLVENDHGCSVVLRHTFDGDLCPQLRKEVNVRRVGNSWELLAIPGLRQLIWNKAGLPTPDVVYTLEQCWASTGLLIRDVFPKGRTIAITGAYHPNQFCYEGRPVREGKVQKLRQVVYDRYYPDWAKFFMSDEVLKGHEEFFQRRFEGGFIWPLPLVLPAPATVGARKADPNIIMSVGRLTPFKTYNTYMVDVVAKLREKYPNIMWVVYGFGPDETRLLEGPWKRLIETGALEFRGLVPYQELLAALASAKVFIGMGTALLEAGALGIPSIPAIIYDENGKSYGHLTDLPYHTCGEVLPTGPPQQEIWRIFDQTLSMDEGQYSELCRKHREYMEEYSIHRVMLNWIEQIGRLCKNAPAAYPLGSKLQYLLRRILQLCKARLLCKGPWA
jgi:glycosyltransferase involved in cell wall biosynthesis